MKVIIYGSGSDANTLIQKIRNVLEELWLGDFITLEQSNDASIKKELDITKDSALVIEEESIDFKDVIFEGVNPEEEELKSMFISLVGGGENWGCCGDDTCADTECGDDMSCGGCSCGH